MAVKVLCVEDDKNINLMLQIIFKKKRGAWELRTAHSGPEAIEILKAYQPDAILLDIMMPGMTGIELAAEIRKNSSLNRSRLAALSATDDERTMGRAKDAGIEHYWIKPIDSETLLKNLEQLLA
jgi:CheY-like chemotaxis protein